MTIAGIVVAGGSGSRFGGAKHRVTLGGSEMWELAQNGLLAGGVDTVIVVGDVSGGVTGGVRRQDSVAAGLAEVPAGAQLVLVHDAARPLAGPDIVAAVIERLSRGDVDAVIPVVRVSDTVKRVERDVVVETLDRADLVAVQTPQGFRREVLVRAHSTVVEDVTDDAQMVELIGGTVVTVAGSKRNLKVTYPEDLVVAEALL